MLYARKGAVILGFNSKRVMFCDRGLGVIRKEVQLHTWLDTLQHFNGRLNFSKWIQGSNMHTHKF